MKNRFTKYNPYKLTRHVSEAFLWSKQVDLLDFKKMLETIWRLDVTQAHTPVNEAKDIIFYVDKFVPANEEIIYKDK